VLVIAWGEADLPVGYVDHSGVLAAGAIPPLAENESFTEMRPFTGEEAARTALENGDIQAYFVLAPDYLTDNHLALFYWDDQPSELVYGDINDFIRANVVAEQPAVLRELLIEGPDLVVRTADGSREFNSQTVLSFFIPFIAAFFFMFVVMSSSGYLLQIVTDEKENRTIEIMMTTVSPGQLIGGKAFGLMGVAVSQILVWMLGGIALVAVGAVFIPPLRHVSVPWSMVLIVALFFVPSYALVTGMMTTIGSVMGNLQQAQQVAGVINLLFLFPFFFMALFFTAPNSPVVVVMTFFPTTAFLTVMMRWGMSSMPVWQVGVSWLVLVGTAVFFLWFASRIFHLGMLRYGKTFSLRETWTAVRARS
jgi:ABC-2 type transport system permease protein